MKLDVIAMWLILVLGMGLAFTVLGIMIFNSKPKPPEPTILFSCYTQEGTKCSVTSNKENPCSYAFLVCKTPVGKTIYRSENIK